MPVLLREESHREVVENAIITITRHSRNFELIIVDDGSPLDTAFLRESASTYIRHKTNKGIAPSWNDGLSVARGDFLTIVNDDVETCWGWLEGMMYALRGDICVSAPAIEHINSGKTGLYADYKWFPGYCFMMPRSTYEIIGKFDEQFTPFNYEDTDYWTRVLKDDGTLMRNFDVSIRHKEGDVLHGLAYDEVSAVNKQKFIDKHGFDPIPVFYGSEKFPYES